MSRSKRKQRATARVGESREAAGADLPLLDSRLQWRLSPSLCAGLLIITIAAYWNVWAFGYQVFDDGNYVSHNPFIVEGLNGKSIAWAFTTFRLSNWHPLTWLSFMSDHRLYGGEPGGFHATNLALHALNVLLLYALFTELTNCRVQSAFVAALFAVHPLHVESVAWISQRKDVLSTAFGLLALIAYVRYARQSSKAWYLASLTAFVCSLLSKQMLVTLPVLLVLLDVWPLRRFGPIGAEAQNSSEGRRTSDPVRRLVFEKLPYVVIALLFAIVIVVAQRYGGGLADLDRFGWDVRIKNAVLASVLYLWKTVLPIDLAVYYPHPEESISVLAAGASTLLLVLLTTAAVALRKRAPYFLFGWSWFLVSSLPVIGIVQVGEQQMADRYSYVPHIGLFVAVAWGVPALLPATRWKKSFLSGVAMSAILLLAAQCRTQVEYWRDDTAMLLHTVDVTGGSHFAHHNLGIAYVRRRDYAAAMPHFRLALEFKADSWSSNYSLGNCLQITGGLAEAQEHYFRALELNPESAEINNNLGMLHLRQERCVEAIEHFRRALQLRPDLANARDNLQLAISQHSLQLRDAGSNRGGSE